MGALNGKVAIVTGASTGIGRSIALRFAREGATVVVAARRRDMLDELTAEIHDSGGAALAVPTDVTSERDVLALFATTLRECQRLDILVNNAGIAAHKPTEALTLGEWQSVLDCNLTGAFLCSREALKLMIPQRSGRILNIGSISAKMPRPASAAYAASKYGLEGLTHCLARDGREHGIAASVLQLGNVATSIRGNVSPSDKQREGMLLADHAAHIALQFVTLPADLNLYEALAFPQTQPLLGRG